MPPDAPSVLCTPLTRSSAAGRLALRHAPRLLGAVTRGLWRDPRGLPGRLRALVAALAEQDAVRSVRALWPGLAGHSAEAERDALAAVANPGDWPSVAVLVLAAGQNGPALAASIAAAAEALRDLEAIRARAGGPSSPADTMADALFVMAADGPAMKATARGSRDRAAHRHLSRCAGEVGSRSEPGEGVRHAARRKAHGIFRAMVRGAWWGGRCRSPLTRPAARGDLSRAAGEVIHGPSGGPAGTPVGSLAEVLAHTSADYLAVLQAGEVVAPHALALLAWHAARLGRPPLLSADEDRLDPDGTRRDPVRKPAAGRILMLSGTLATGVWLIRRDLLAGLSAAAPPWAPPLGGDLAARSLAAAA